MSNMISCKACWWSCTISWILQALYLCEEEISPKSYPCHLWWISFDAWFFEFQYFSQPQCRVKNLRILSSLPWWNQTAKSRDASLLHLTVSVCYVQWRLEPQQQHFVPRLIKKEKNKNKKNRGGGQCSLSITKTIYFPWPKPTCSLSGYVMHPQDFSCSVFKFPRATSPLPCSCVEGTLPVALTCLPNFPLYLTYTSQHCISIS